MSFDWQNLTNGSFKGIPFHVAIPSRDQQYGVESEEMSLERRLQFIKRPLVDGAPVRDWGAEPETYVAVIEFFGVNHAKTAETFLQALNEGTPGTLILPTIPKAVLAYFWKRTRSTDYRDGNAIRVTVTWVAAAEINNDLTGRAPGVSLTPTSIDEAKSSLDSDVSNALSILQDNPFLSAVRTFEGGLSQVRSVANAVLTLEEGVRNRITSLDANLKGTLDLLKGATDEIQGIFGSRAKSTSQVAATQSLGTNSETGQTITDFSEPDTIPPPVDPLAPPPVEPEISIPTANLDSESGVTNFGNAAFDELNSNRDELVSLSGGRTDDVDRAITAVLNSLSAYLKSVIGDAPITFTLPIDMSLGEALFLNGIDLSQLRAIQKVNPQVTDPFFIPKGTVLVL